MKMKLMNKHLLIILLGFGSFGVFADDEFPIELTCELGTSVIYFHFSGSKDGNWWKPHKSTLNGNGVNDPLHKKSFQGKQNKNIKNIRYTDTQISFLLSTLNLTRYVSINRYNLKIASVSRGSGQCYKGFKEYEKQI